MRRTRKPYRAMIEALETRTLMASDFKIAFYLETLDTNNIPVSRVEVGDNFKLRMSVEEFNPVLNIDRGVGGYTGIRFNSNLADKTGELAFADGYSLARDFRVKAPGEWEDVGAQPNLNSREFAASPRRHVQWEVLMQAKSGGEVVFESNPSDHAGIALASMYLNSSEVSFGFARLQIGDQTQFPASPWRNPGNPSDVDGNGVVTEADLEAIESILGIRPSPESLSNEVLTLVPLGSRGRIELDGSIVPRNKAPYLDIDGNRIVDFTDVFAVREMFAKNFGTEPFSNMLDFLFEPTYQLGLNVVNIRTGLEVNANSEVLEGDLLEVKMQGEHHEAISNSWSKLVQSPHFKVLHAGYGQNYLLAATGPGPLEIRFEPNVELYSLSALLVGISPQVLQARLQELLNSLSRTIIVKENGARPQAQDRLYSYQQFVGLQSARETAELLKKPDASTLSIDANRGVIQNVSPDQRLRAVLVKEPSQGQLSFNDDGSFEYAIYGTPYYSSLYEHLKAGDKFSYAIVSAQGVSEVREVRIQGIELPLVDLNVKVVDESGKEISSIEIGQEAFLEVSAFANYLYRIGSPETRIPNPLYFDFTMDRTVGLTVGTPVVSELFNWERLSLVQERGKLVLKSEIAGPQVYVADNENKAVFDRYTLSVQQAVLLRQKIVGTQPGPLNVSINDAFLDLENVDPAAVHVEAANVQVVAGASTAEARFDVSGNGELSPLDALLVINRLNALRAGGEILEASSTLMQDVCDVNRDGEVSPLDILLVVNQLNARIKSARPAEGESDVLINRTSAIDAAFTDLNEEAPNKKRTRR